MRRRASVCQLYRLKEGRKERVSERPVWLWIHIGPRLLNFPLLLVRSGGINNIISRLCWEWYGFGFQSGWVDGWKEGEYSVQHSSTKAHWKWIESRFSPLSLFLNIYAMRPVLAIWLTWHSETCKCWAHGTYNHPSIYLTRSHHWHLSASHPAQPSFIRWLVILHRDYANRSVVVCRLHRIRIETSRKLMKLLLTNRISVALSLYQCNKRTNQAVVCGRYQITHSVPMIYCCCLLPIANVFYKFHRISRMEEGREGEGEGLFKSAE